MHIRKETNTNEKGFVFLANGQRQINSADRYMITVCESGEEDFCGEYDQEECRIMSIVDKEKGGGKFYRFNKNIKGMLYKQPDYSRI